MKTLKYSLTGLLVLMLSLVLTNSDAYSNKLNKTLTKEFSAEKGSVVRIENRFGQVNIENWEKNSVSIEVEVTVEHPSKDRAERMLSSINIILEQNGSEIRAITEIDEKAFKSLSGFSFNSSTKELSINYKVKMPKELNLILKNKFGDVFINEITGLSQIDLKYGNLKANRIFYGSNEPLSSLVLGYGNASIDEVDWMRVDIKYSDISVTSSKAMVVLSKYSKINIESISSLVVESKYDHFTIGSISNLVGESGYTSYKIKRIDKKLDISTRYGDVRISEVAKNFESIRFNGSYSSIYAPIDPSASFNIKGDASYGGITYNTPARVSRIESNNKVSVNGTVGSNENSSSSINITVRYGSANLK
jgi:hypothetical protein